MRKAYAIVTAGGNTVVLHANNIKEARRKFKRNHNNIGIRSIKLIRIPKTK